MAGRDNDDIIEDYDVIPEGSPQGGPPPMPGSAQPAPMTARERGAAAAAKGKISKGQAKLIWIICIVVCVVGVAAVGVHFFFLRPDPQPRPAPPRQPDRPIIPTTPKRELTEHEQNAREFMAAVTGHMRNVNRSRAFDMFMTARVDMTRWVQEAQRIKGTEELDGLEDAWLNAIRAFQRAKYAEVLTLHVNRAEDLDVEGFDLSTDTRFEDVLKLSDDQLMDARLQRYHGARVALGRYSAEVNRFQADHIKHDMTCSKLWLTRKADFAAESERLQAAREGVFPPEDLEHAKGPLYGPDEEMEYEKLMDKLRADAANSGK